MVITLWRNVWWYYEIVNHFNWPYILTGSVFCPIQYKMIGWGSGLESNHYADCTCHNSEQWQQCFCLNVVWSAGLALWIKAFNIPLVEWSSIPAACSRLIAPGNSSIRPFFLCPLTPVQPHREAEAFLFMPQTKWQGNTLNRSSVAAGPSYKHITIYTLGSSDPVSIDLQFVEMSRRSTVG